jgi:hypothetical protein
VDGSDAACPPTDQRGVARFDGDGDTVVTCDVGAFEVAELAPEPIPMGRGSLFALALALAGAALVVLRPTR